MTGLVAVELMFFLLPDASISSGNSSNIAITVQATLLGLNIPITFRGCERLAKAGTIGTIWKHLKK